MKTLVYKRTHKGDPDETGCFGIHDCMGTVRNRNFDAVIGVGGIGNKAKAAGISGKVNWIGIGPRKQIFPNMRGPLVRFDHFILFEDDGPNFNEIAPILSRHIYSRNVRVLAKFNHIEQAEIERILKMAQTSSPSKTRAKISKVIHCKRCCRKI
ncbi:MAG TPA: hypothetical protein VKT33_09140 [Candidatus Angelobacter sp.]|nr:hypothetical protein [Candidatus Angelobacter sp.]